MEVGTVIYSIYGQETPEPYVKQLLVIEELFEDYLCHDANGGLHTIHPSAVILEEADAYNQLYHYMELEKSAVQYAKDDEQTKIEITESLMQNNREDLD